ncbi:hypothetical protein A4X09_0g4238 [Tilletia walkeri]|uniref:Uncharacterized protein n=1 Tax=Tilletia walkeri TaxID=117179 RepID=A0A8X7T468_9BASI|nr:hypothetical protein A4X09_0g4238 [Tilletia walkeri]
MVTEPEPGLPGTRTARRTRRSAKSSRRQASPCRRRDDSDGKTQNARREGTKRRQGLSHRQFIEVARRGRCKTAFGYLTDKVNGRRARINVRDLSETAWPVRRDEALRRPRRTMEKV